jgi:hypothetical protein
LEVEAIIKAGEQREFMIAKLKHYCDPKNPVYKDYHAPISIAGRTYACNRCVAVRVQGIFGEEISASFISEYLEWGNDYNQDSLSVTVSLGEVEAFAKPCDACEEHGAPHGKPKRTECLACQGTGWQWMENLKAMPVGSAPVDPRRVAQLITDFGQLVFDEPESRVKILHFRFAGGEGFIMPMNL